MARLTILSSIDERGKEITEIKIGYSLSLDLMLAIKTKSRNLAKVIRRDRNKFELRRILKIAVMQSPWLRD